MPKAMPSAQMSRQKANGEPTGPADLLRLSVMAYTPSVSMAVPMNSV
ncbi:hypothetical protein PF008_g29313 [Phytophthora fragariae]|uniref:Uncharacterized protein n=1 Tax=Phytophthora fragariae TaxID=53985 RepID=A0A6G0Q8S1_9STRA|nr:hypothetical protein PF008_g29313 [Phytophthora fragariae]